MFHYYTTVDWSLSIILLLKNSRDIIRHYIYSEWVEYGTILISHRNATAYDHSRKCLRSKLLKIDQSYYNTEAGYRWSWQAQGIEFKRFYGDRFVKTVIHYIEKNVNIRNLSTWTHNRFGHNQDISLHLQVRFVGRKKNIRNKNHLCTLCFQNFFK